MLFVVFSLVPRPHPVTIGPSPRAPPGERVGSGDETFITRGMASSRDSFTVAKQHCDLTGLPLTCRSDEALEWYNKALIAHVTYREDPLPFATRALELDDSLLLGHCLVVCN